MALPPTAFKDLLSGSHDAVYDALREKRCLSWRGRRNREAVLAVMQEAARRYADWLNDALLASAYVNRKARRLANKDTRWG